MTTTPMSAQERAAEQLQRYRAWRETIEAWRRLDTSGIYVYTLPHYLSHPFDPESGRTLLKIGSAKSRVISRIREQVRSTALPEDPVLLRIYEPGNVGSPEDPVLLRINAEYVSRKRSPENAEHLLHYRLQYLGHHKNSGEFCGMEWFLTDLATIDTEAKAVHMPVRFRNDDGLQLTKG
jgi:hypothetical protein